MRMDVLTVGLCQEVEREVAFSPWWRTKTRNKKTVDRQNQGVEFRFLKLCRKLPYKWQKSAFSHLFSMKRESIVFGQPLRPMLLCVPTGDRKSLLHDACAVLCGGVSLCI